MSNEPGKPDFLPNGQGEEGQVPQGHPARGQVPDARPAGPQGPKGPGSDEAFADMTFGYLAGLSQKDREEALSRVPTHIRQQLETELARRASGAPGEEGEGTGFDPAAPEPTAEEVEKEKASIDRAVDLIKEGKVKEGWMALEKPGEHGEAAQLALDTIKESETLSSADEKIVTETLSKFNDTDHPFSRQEGEFLLDQFTNLSPDVKKRILDSLLKVDEIGAKSGDDEVVRNELPVDGEDMKKALMNQNDEIDELLRTTPDLTDDEKAKIRSVKGKIGSLYTKVSDFFGPDTNGRKWLRRSGKALYFSLIGLFLIVVLEMNMINKLSRRQGK